MARVMFILALCVLLPAMISAARPMSRLFRLQGKVYCDTCRAGFETFATTYIPHLGYSQILRGIPDWTTFRSMHVELQAPAPDLYSFEMARVSRFLGVNRFTRN
ncbi:hypothetical protein L1987_52493 [Smallanthus sonchifolius]|uniref:Uncharacterized protein n=1 Tax=Smallanthus sonchifolius TaxID=185202 RepID=A0ACB9ETK8_9ASTR|nr:hypothetical protein L1987_52493 [Smallanthus sonchifolius]